MWKMTFLFNDEKARALGTSAQSCYEAVDKLFARYGIEPAAQGVYEAPDNQNSFTAFAVAHKLPYSDWFLKVIEQWFFYEDDGEPEDCLEAHYRFEEKNKGQDKLFEPILTVEHKGYYAEQVRSLQVSVSKADVGTWFFNADRPATEARLRDLIDDVDAGRYEHMREEQA